MSGKLGKSSKIKAVTIGTNRRIFGQIRLFHVFVL